MPNPNAKYGLPSAAYKITWKGRSVEQAVVKATVEAMTETLEACVAQAKIFAPYRTGALRDDISYDEPQIREKRITARWGNREVYYSIFQEIGTSRNPAVRYLQRAADAEYPKLNERIARRVDAA